MGRPVARWLRRSALRTDSPALLVPGSCGATRFARCARFAQTQRRKSDVRSALRAPTPGLRCSAPQKARNRAPHRLRSGPGRSAGQMHRPFPPFAGLPPLAAMAPTLVIDAKTAVVPTNADRLPHVVRDYGNTAYTSCDFAFARRDLGCARRHVACKGAGRGDQGSSAQRMGARAGPMAALCAAPSSAASGSAREARFVHLTCGAVSERSSRSERSELRRTTPTRAAQGSRCAAPTAAVSATIGPARAPMRCAELP